MSATAKPVQLARSIRGGQHFGLLAVIMVLAAALTVFGGRVRISEPIVDPVTGEIRRNSDGSVMLRTIERSRFLNPDNLINGIVKDGSFYAVMAVGAAFVIITAGIDLSVGSIFCLAGVTTAMLLHAFGPRGSWSAAPPLLASLAGVLTCLLVATAAGWLNGVLIVRLGVHPFVITLGTMQIYRCIALVISGAEPFGNFPPMFTSSVRVRLGDLGVVPLAVVVLAVAAGTILLARTRLGRYAYAVGGNETAALYSGIGVKRLKVVVYALAGFSAGVAALLSLGYYGAAQSDWGRGAELKVIASCVVGGVSLLGGRGSAIGALLGTITIFMIINAIDILRIDNNYSDGVVGAVIILAVLLDRVSRRSGSG
ncbi:MAG: D-allose transport system permease protein AlsC [Phycisphaerae bacterium]|nr:D-allose transport system permease protein AlsC [Phycisphaerae bacterium]